MNNVSERLKTKVRIAHADLVEFSKKELEANVKKELARRLADYLVEHMDELPVTLTREDVPSLYAIDYTLDVHIVSESFIKELKSLSHLLK